MDLLCFHLQAMNLMGSGFSAINIGDEIIEINKQVVVSLFCSMRIYIFVRCQDRLGSETFQFLTSTNFSSE